MQKKKKSIIAGYTILTIFAITFLYTSTLQITGHAIYSEQPNPTEGKDTYLRQLSTTNYGTSTTLKVGTASTAGGQEFRSLLYFNVSSIPETDTIVSATLSIYITSSATENNITLNTYQITSNWNEEESSWYNNSAISNWTSAGSDYNSNEIASTTLTNQTGWYNITITSLISDWITGSEENYGLLLYAPSAGVGDSKEIASSDYTINTNFRPKLTIEHAENAPPQLNSITTDSSAESPTEIGNDVTFTLNWTDLEGDNAQTFICSSDSITTSGCADTTFCSTSLSSTNPTTCAYTTRASNNKTTSFWAATCDENNCTTSTQQYFYVNNIPVISLQQPNGGETINQSQGNYSIIFNVSDADSDTISANIYYGETQNSTTSTVQTNINLTNFCTDVDSDTSTINICTYSWNSSGIYGTYYLTIQLNDSYSISTDSSESSIIIRSIEDNIAPQIISTSIEPNTHSGKSTNVNATITDDNTLTAWILFNYTSTNITMTENSTNFYNGSFLAPQPGTHKYKIYATDLVGNSNETEWQSFTVAAPNATILNQTTSSIALPYSVIKVDSYIYANSSLRNLYAYLNVPEGFTFLSDYPQNLYLGNLSQGETSNATWFLSCPISEDTYTLNITYSDTYTNTWNSSNLQTQVTSSIGGGYTTTISGYPQVVKGNPYYVETTFLQSGTATEPDSSSITLINPIGFSSGELSLTEESTGSYYYNYTVPSDATEGIWQTIINYTISETSYIAQEFWKVLGTLFDVREITIIDSQTPSLNISVILENIGTAQADMNLEWNLTREDTGAILNSGAEEIGVNSGQTLTHTVYPETFYVGQVRITFIGSYGEDHSQKAGAYKIFSTTSGTTPETPPSGGGGGGGGGGGSTEPVEQVTSLTLSDISPIIYVTKGIEKIISLDLINNGTVTLNNIQITMQNLKEETYEIIPSFIEKLSPDKQEIINIKFLFNEPSKEENPILTITSQETSIAKTFKIITLSLNEYYEKELELLKNSLNSLRNLLIEKEDLTSLKGLSVCENYIDSIEIDVEKEDFTSAQENIDNANECLKEVKEKSDSIIPKIGNFWTWAITWTLIIILILVLIIVIIVLYKKVKLIDFLKQNKKENNSEPKKETELDKKIKEIKEKIKENSSSKPKTF